MQTPKIDKATIIRTIALFIFALNAVLALFGVSPIPVSEDDVTSAVDAVYAAVSAIGLIVAVVAAWWKDNNITEWARKNKKPKK